MGNQRHSMPMLIQGAKEVKDDIIGNAYFAKAWYANNRKSIGTGKKCRFLQRWILICGKGPRHAEITRITWCIITGTGSGIGARAKLVIMERTK